MGLFRRRPAEPAATSVPTNDEAAVGNSAAAPTGSGPYDAAEVPDLGLRVDLGALRVPVLPGMQMRMELDRATQQITGATLMLQQPEGVSSLQLQVFAAPKSSGIWDEIRGEISQGITASGGQVDDVPGEFGRELIAHIPRGGEVRKARFLGHDGPRWFLRGVITGPAASSPEAAAKLEDMFRNIVVVRDNTPKPPRDLLPLTLPGSAEKLPGDPNQAKPLIDPMERGPEIAEVR